MQNRYPKNNIVLATSVIISITAMYILVAIISSANSFLSIQTNQPLIDIILQALLAFSVVYLIFSLVFSVFFSITLNYIESKIGHSFFYSIIIYWILIYLIIFSPELLSLEIGNSGDNISNPCKVVNNNKTVNCAEVIKIQSIIIRLKYGAIFAIVGGTIFNIVRKHVNEWRYNNA